MSEVPLYRGTSLIRHRPPYEPAVGLCLGPYGGPGEEAVLMSKVPLYMVAKP